jgi:hypothetical protein
MGEESMKGKAKSVTKPLSIDLIPKLNGKKVVIRLVSGG